MVAVWTTDCPLRTEVEYLFKVSRNIFTFPPPAGEESDSGRSYTSSRSESGSRSPEDVSRATTPGVAEQDKVTDPESSSAADTSQVEPHNLSVGGQQLPPSSLALPPPLLPPQLPSQPAAPLPLTSPSARTPVDLTSPSPGPQPEVQVLEPEPATTPVTPCPPSPELRLEDVECHRSQSAIFVRHYNRGGKTSDCVFIAKFSSLSLYQRVTPAPGRTSTSSLCRTPSWPAREKSGCGSWRRRSVVRAVPGVSPVCRRVSPDGRDLRLVTSRPAPSGTSTTWTGWRERRERGSWRSTETAISG